jgi:hypothetical protein
MLRAWIRQKQHIRSLGLETARKELEDVQRKANNLPYDSAKP